MSSSRKDVRQALAGVLDREVTSAQAVYAFQKARIKGQTPVLCVTSAGSAREALTMQGSAAAFRLDINVFVLYSDGSTWTEEQAEDMLDDLEQQIADVCDRYRVSNKWARLAYAEPSDARTPIVLEGVTYLHEVIPVEIRANS